MKLTSTLLLLAFVCNLNAQEEKLKLSVFYESLCPGCRQFIPNQLFPTYQELTDYISIELVPFGNADYGQDSSGKWIFNCQHGTDECEGNKYQSCALAHGGDINFIKCIEVTGNPTSTDNLEQCCKDTNISWTDVKNCYDSGEGDNLLAQYGNRTKSLNPPLKWVPSVWFNDVYNEQLDDDAFNGLKKVVCSLLTSKPTPCQ